MLATVPQGARLHHSLGDTVGAVELAGLASMRTTADGLTVLQPQRQLNPFFLARCAEKVRHYRIGHLDDNVLPLPGQALQHIAAAHNHVGPVAAADGLGGAHHVVLVLLPVEHTGICAVHRVGHVGRHAVIAGALQRQLAHVGAPDLQAADADAGVAGIAAAVDVQRSLAARHLAKAIQIVADYGVVAL